jgi:hypothetical protein
MLVTAVLATVPSLPIQVTVRAAVFGLPDVLLYLTLRSAV